MVLATAAIAGTCIIGFLLLGFVTRRGVDRVADWLRSLPKAGVVLSDLWQAVCLFRRRMRVMGYGVLLTAASHFAIVLTFYFAASVFPPEHPETDLATLPELMVIAPIGFVAQALPAGGREGAWEWAKRCSRAYTGSPIAPAAGGNRKTCHAHCGMATRIGERGSFISGCERSFEPRVRRSTRCTALPRDSAVKQQS